MVTRHRRHRHEAVMILAGSVMLSALAGLTWVVFILAHFLVLVLVLAVAAVAVAWRAGQHRRPPRRLVQARPAHDRELTALRAENAQLHAQVSQLRREAQDATTAMHAAWDAASSVPPRASQEHSAARDQLTRTPLSGVRELGGPR
jgi:cell division protein FtsB